MVSFAFPVCVSCTIRTVGNSYLTLFLQLLEKLDRGMGVASNETEEAGASSLFCVRTHARIGDVL